MLLQFLSAYKLLQLLRPVYEALEWWQAKEKEKEKRDREEWLASMDDETRARYVMEQVSFSILAASLKRSLCYSLCVCILLLSMCLHTRGGILSISPPLVVYVCGDTV
jgi:hypothetical protein